MGFTYQVSYGYENPFAIVNKSLASAEPVTNKNLLAREKFY